MQNIIPHIKPGLKKDSLTVPVSVQTRVLSQGCELLAKNAKFGCLEHKFLLLPSLVEFKGN